MISKGSCDTEDWSCKFSFDHRNKLHFKHMQIEKKCFKMQKNISQYYLFLIKSNKCRFGEQKTLLIFLKKNLSDQTQTF